MGDMKMKTIYFAVMISVCAWAGNSDSERPTPREVRQKLIPRAADVRATTLRQGGIIDRQLERRNCDTRNVTITGRPRRIPSIVILAVDDGCSDCAVNQDTQTFFQPGYDWGVGLK